MAGGKYVCKECGEEFDAKGKFLAHTRWQHPKKSSDSVVGEKLDTVIELLKDSKAEVVYHCPDCNGPLSLMPDGPGLFKLRCQYCYEGG